MDCLCRTCRTPRVTGTLLTLVEIFVDSMDQVPMNATRARLLRLVRGGVNQDAVRVVWRRDDYHDPGTWPGRARSQIGSGGHGAKVT